MRYFSYENVKLEVLGAFGASIRWRSKTAHNLSFVLEERIKIQIHVSKKLTPGIDPHVISDIIFY